MDPKLGGTPWIRTALDGFEGARLRWIRSQVGLRGFEPLLMDSKESDFDGFEVRWGSMGSNCADSRFIDLTRVESSRSIRTFLLLELPPHRFVPISELRPPLNRTLTNSLNF
jgi:hypothetical protein